MLPFRFNVSRWHIERAPTHTCRGLHCSKCLPCPCLLAISHMCRRTTTLLRYKVCGIQEEWQDVASPDADDAADEAASESQPKAAAAALKGKAELEMPNAEGAAAGQVGSCIYLRCG